MNEQKTYDQELDETFRLYFPEPDGLELLRYDAGGAPVYSAEFSAEAQSLAAAEAEARRESLARYVQYDEDWGD